MQKQKIMKRARQMHCAAYLINGFSDGFGLSGQIQDE